MARLNKLSQLDRLNRVWTPSHYFGLLRIVLGFAVLYESLKISFDFDTVVGTSGVGGYQYFGLPFGADFFGRSYLYAWKWLHLISSDEVIWLLLTLLILASALVTIGVLTRFVLILTLILFSLFHARNEFAFWGWSDFVAPFMVYLFFTPAARTLSIDRWRKPDLRVTYSWQAWIFLVHTITIYTTAAYSRLNDPMWLDGTALFRILIDREYSRVPDIFLETFSLAWGSFGQLAFKVVSWGSWGLELLAPLGLAIQGTRRSFGYALILMHIGLEATTMVGWWNYMMICLLLITMFSFERRQV